MIQQLIVPLLSNCGKETPLNALVARLQDLPTVAIAQQSWPQFKAHATAAFCMAYTDHSLLVQFEVTETAIRAVHTEINAPVYEDSCVELFIAFDPCGYYNFEFNCMGTPLVAYGKDKINRQFLEKELIRKIATQVHVCCTAQGGYAWQLAIQIPFPLFVHHPHLQWRGLQCRANLYKCGDALPQPHFLSWAPIHAPAPDFHLPQFFGTLHFDASNAAP